MILISDYEVRNTAMKVISVLMAAFEAGIASQITGDFMISSAIGGGTALIHMVCEPLLSGRVLNKPNGIYTIESIYRSESYGAGTQISESYELYYGETNKGTFYVGLWYWRLTTGPGINDYDSSVLFEGEYIARPEVIP